MKKLTKVGIETGTDKANYHEFTEFYDQYFSDFISPRIMEIGVYKLKSIEMYLKYFDEPYILGIDIIDKTNYLNNKWVFKQCDQSKIKDLIRITENEEKFNIIIDDGGHTMKQQQVSLGYLIDYVKPKGYYIVEDLHTSFRANFIESDCKVTTYDLLLDWKNGKLTMSNYISEKQQKNIINKIEFIEFYYKNPNDLTDSVTSVIKLK